jgi:hypothetical protein
MKNIMMTGVFALAMIAAPALAQTSGAGVATQSSPSGTGVEQGATSDGSMTGMGTPGMAPKKMSKSQMAQMQKCQAMTPEMMQKSKSCTKMAKMHPEMMSGSPAPM